jgi:hypothetical protein
MEFYHLSESNQWVFAKASAKMNEVRKRIMLALWLEISQQSSSKDLLEISNRAFLK